jgi:hypothetical protein
MNKLMVAAGIAVLSLSFAGLGYAVQGQGDTGGDPRQSSPPPSGMGSDRGSQHEGDAATTDKQKKKRKSGESNLDVDKAGKGHDSGKSAPKAGSEGSNPTLDKSGKGSATGG